METSLLPNSGQNAFVGAIYNKGRDGNVEFAKRVCALPEIEGNLIRLVFFVDASFRRGKTDVAYDGSPGAFAIVYREWGSRDNWVAKIFFIPKMFGINWRELAAIMEAMNMARLRVAALKGSYKSAEVSLFSDSLGSFDSILYRTAIKQKEYDLTMARLRNLVKDLSHCLRDLGDK